MWEVIAALKAIRDERPDLDGPDLINGLVAVTGLSAAQASAALDCYAAHPKEIDERIAINAERAQREERLWATKQNP